MDTEDELWARLDEAEGVQRGPARSAALEAVVARADAAGFEQLGLAGRMRLTDSYHNGGEPAKAFATFSHCLGVYRRTPERFPDGSEWNLRWQFKYMVSSMVRFPNVSLAQTSRLLDDMESEYRRAGSTLHALYSARHTVSRHVGDRAAAEDDFRRWTTTPRDLLSDCIGCDPESQVVWLARTGRDAEAATLADDVLGGRMTCIEQPHSILTELLLPYVRLGRLADAVDAHLRGYRGIRHELTFLEKVATHIEFCALTGNEARGLELVERHLPQLDVAPDPMAEMLLAAGAALLLRRLVDLGHADLTVATEVGDPSGTDTPSPSTVGEWHERLTRRARGVAADFDRRNGTTAQSDRVRSILAAVPLLPELPLRSTFAVRAELRPAGPVPHRAGATPAASDGLDTRDLDIRDLDIRDLDIRDLVRRFVDGRVLDEPELAAVGAALARRVDECPPELVGHAWLAAAADAAEHDDDALAAGHADRAVAAFTAAGDAAGTAWAELRLAAYRLATSDDPAPWVARARAAWETVRRESGDPQLVAAARQRTFQLLANAGEYDAAGELLETVDDATGDPHMAAHDLGARAWWAMVHGEPDEAARLAADAAALHRSHGHPVRAARLAPIRARCAAGAGRPDDAVAIVDDAFAVATDTGQRAALHELRGQAHVDRGDLDAAVDDLREAVTGFLLAGEPTAAAYAGFTLGWCELHRGRALDAAEVLEGALPGYEAAGDPLATARTRRLLVDALGMLGEVGEALRHGASASAALTTAERWSDRADLDTAVARIAARDRHPDVPRLYGRAVEAWDLAGDAHAAADAQRERARQEMAFDPTSAAATFADARARVEALAGLDGVDLDWERAECDSQQAWALWFIDRNEEAAPYAEAAEAGFAAAGDQLGAARSALMRGRLLAERREAAPALEHLRRAGSLLPTEGDDATLAQAARIAADVDELVASLADDARDPIGE